jgi:hypothetical protein
MYDIKMNVGGVGCEDVVCIKMDWEEVQCLASASVAEQSSSQGTTCASSST